jgi:hypothetical protein
MASFMVSLLVGDDTMRARGHVNIKGKPVSTDPSTPLRVHKACQTLWFGAAGCAKAGFGSARIVLYIRKRVIPIGVSDDARDRSDRAAQWPPDPPDGARRLREGLATEALIADLPYSKEDVMPHLAMP